MNQFLSQCAGRDRSGFTLIEVLIGVIVLGLGLLGLASIFPAVVVQQRQAADAVQGDSTSKSVESFIRASPQLNEPFAGAFDRVRIDRTFSPPAARQIERGRTQWDMGTDSPGANAPMAFDTNNDGALIFGVPEAGNIVADVAGYFNSVRTRIDDVGEIEISQFMRLYPNPKFRDTPNPTPAQQSLRAKNDGPQFVWDVAIRRDKGTSGTLPPRGSDALQVALFVRRLDPGIRGDLNTVFDPASATRVLAVAENGPASRPEVVGVPTLDGGRTQGSVYSPIRRAQLSVYRPAGNATPVARNRVVYAAGSVDRVSDEAVLAWLPRAGQKFVGPQGQVWTVLGVTTEGTGANQVVIMTLDDGIEDRTQDEGGTTVDILFTMQTPANVRVFSISAPQRAAYGAN